MHETSVNFHNIKKLRRSKFKSLLNVQIDILVKWIRTLLTVILGILFIKIVLSSVIGLICQKTKLDGRRFNYGFGESTDEYPQFIKPKYLMY